MRRFHKKYTKTASGCWLWTAAKNNRGYGVIGYGGEKRMVLAHRLSWILHYGEIPSGLWVLHKCDVRECVNPEHLYLGDVKDNARDLMERGNPYCFELRKHITKEVEARRVAALPRGRKHHRSAAKIDEKTARAIYKAEGSQREIAERFGLCQQTVSQIKRLATWRHVNG